MQGAVMLVANRETRREYAAKIIDTRKCVSVHNTTFCDSMMVTD
jgi:hypothetical protein